MKTLAYSLLVALGLVLAGTAAQAQNSNASEATTMARQSKEIKDTATLAEWETNSLYEARGIRAEYLITEEVYGPEGEEIGNVENVIMGQKGQIVALILEVGGFWDIATTHVVVPWKKVTLIPDGIKVPVTEDNYDDFLLFGEGSIVSVDALQQTDTVNDIMATGANTWKLTVLLDDYVVLQNGEGYGYLADVLFSKDGQIIALIVQSSAPEYGNGVYAFPYYGYKHGWQPYDNVYVLPYGKATIKALVSFKYNAFDGYWY